MSKSGFWKRFGARLLKNGAEKKCYWCGEWVESMDVLRNGRMQTTNEEGNEIFRHMATIDHLLPRADGGTNDLSNLVVACYPCNTGRGRNRANWKKAKV